MIYGTSIFIRMQRPVKKSTHRICVIHQLTLLTSILAVLMTILPSLSWKYKEKVGMRSFSSESVDCYENPGNGVT